jgi:hypothetical protein
MAKLRLDLASVAYWRYRPREARDPAEGGLRYLAGGPNAAQLHLKYGRAAARLGDISSARCAVDEARDARERRNHPAPHGPRGTILSPAGSHRGCSAAKERRGMMPSWTS